MRLEEHRVKSVSEEYERSVWLLPGVGDACPQKLCIFLDAEFYLQRMDAPAILQELQAEGRIPSVTCLFVSHGEGADRHHDYTCNARYARFIAKDLLGWYRARGDGSPEGGGDHVICGLSLSGLASAYIALTYPDIFSSALCQSGSFWWNGEWLAENLPSFSTSQGRFWVSVGDEETEAGVSHPPTGMRQEVSQRDAAKTFVSALAAAGATVHSRVFSGGHAIAPWKEELPAALQWLLTSRTPRPAGVQAILSPLPALEP